MVFTVAIDVLLLLQLPPGVASASVVVYPLHILGVPVIAESAFTVIGNVDPQPVGRVYVIITVPAAPPVTTPVDDPMDATDVELLPHVPPPGEQLNVADKLPHMVLGPLMAPGCGLTVIVDVAIQPDDNV